MKNTKTNNQRGRTPAQTVARLFSGTKALVALAAVACALQARSQITTFDATTNSYTTTVECISPSGAVTGYYDIRDVAHHQFLEFAFIRDLNGQTISFGPPTTNDFDPQGVAINSAGVVAGDYSKYAGQAPDGNGGTFSYYFQSSFLRSVDGTVFNIDPTDAYSSLLKTVPSTRGGSSGDYFEIRRPGSGRQRRHILFTISNAASCEALMAPSSTLIPRMPIARWFLS